MSAQTTIDQRKAVYKALDAADSVADSVPGMSPSDRDAYLLQALREEHPDLNPTQALVLLTTWKADFT